MLLFGWSLLLLRLLLVFGCSCVVRCELSAHDCCFVLLEFDFFQAALQSTPHTDYSDTARSPLTAERNKVRWGTIDEPMFPFTKHIADHEAAHCDTRELCASLDTSAGHTGNTTMSGVGCVQQPKSGFRF